MNEYNIWCSCTGPCTGDEGRPDPPCKIAFNVKGNTFQEAVFNWYMNQERSMDRYGSLIFDGNEEIRLWASRLQPTSSGLFKEFLIKYPEYAEDYLFSHPELIDEIDPNDLI